MKIQKFAAFLGSALLIGSSVMAQQLGVNFNYTGGAATAGTSVWTLGYEFQVTSPITLDGLATFDISGGLLQDVQVGVWADNGNINTSSTLIDSAIVPAGTLPTAGSPFAEVAITPIVLSPGLYDVGSFDVSDPWTADFSGATVAPGISFVQSRYSSDTSFEYPNNNDEPNSVIAWFGGNIVVSGGSVPDASSSLMLLSAACLALGAVRRKLA
jgi:hypothetical protein